jgi:TRAP-type transport system periplasmic protein
LRASASLLALALLATACGTNGAGDDDVDADAADAADADASGDEAPGDDVVEEGESRQITVSIFHPEGDPWTQIVQPFFDEVEERTAGRITFNPQFAGSLASVSDNLDVVSSGAVDMGLDLASTLSTQAPEFTYFEALGSYPQDYAEQWEDIYEALHPEFSAILERQGVKLLTWGPGGSELIFFNRRDNFLTEPSDFEGLTLRTAGTWQGRQIEALGGSSISMDPGELYLALQTGTVDATPQAATLGLGASLYEVAPYLASISLTFNTLLYIINADVWAELSEEDQTILEEAARNASLGAPATMQEQEQQAIERMQSADGVEHYRLTDEERQEIFDTISPVLEEAAEISRNASDEGARLVEAIQSRM